MKKHLFAVLLAIIAPIARATPILLTLDLSDPTHVIITTTGADSAITPAGSFDMLNDGVDLKGFLTAGSSNSALAISPVSNTLEPSGTGGVLFDSFYWDDLTTKSTTQALVDLGLYRLATPITPEVFNTSTPSFVGSMVIDISSEKARFPGLNATGNIVAGWSGDTPSGTIGTWEVIAVAIPEPATSAMLGGALTLIGTVLVRRRTSRAVG